MSSYTANGVIRVLSGINWDASYRDTRYFKSVAEQTSYFLSKPAIFSTEGNSYFRQDTHYISVDRNVETLWGSKYIMFQNQNMGSKWFYAFVDDIIMKAPETTWITYHIDIMQTWMFDAKPIQAYIERRHWGIEKAGDLFFAEEDIGTGTGYITSRYEIVGRVEQAPVLLTSTVDISENGGTFDDPSLTGATGGVINKLPTACDYYLLNYRDGATVYEFFDELKNYPWMSKGIISATIVPSYFLEGLTINMVSVGGSSLAVGKIVDGENASIPVNVYSENVFNNFPKLEYAKMYMYPYSYVELSLMNGSTVKIKPQLLRGGVLNIYRRSALSANPESKYYMEGYEGEGQLYDNSLTARDFPQCPVQDVTYLQTLAVKNQQFELTDIQSKIATGLKAAGGLLGTGISLATGNIVGAGLSIAGLAGGLTGDYFNRKNFEINRNWADTDAPTVSGNVGGTGFNYATGEMGLHIRYRTLPENQRKIVGDYWKLRGYAVQRVETVSPDRMSRFDYVKTNDCHISGNIPNDAIMKMQAVYDSGITFWHDDNIGNYDNNKGVK